MGKHYTLILTESELNDLRSALPKGRPNVGYPGSREFALWDLDDKLKRLKPDPDIKEVLGI